MFVCHSWWASSVTTYWLYVYSVHGCTLYLYVCTLYVCIYILHVYTLYGIYPCVCIYAVCALSICTLYVYMYTVCMCLYAAWLYIHRMYVYTPCVCIYCGSKFHLLHCLHVHRFFLIKFFVVLFYFLWKSRQCELEYILIMTCVMLTLPSCILLSNDTWYTFYTEVLGKCLLAVHRGLKWRICKFVIGGVVLLSSTLTIFFIELSFNPSLYPVQTAGSFKQSIFYAVTSAEM